MKKNIGQLDGVIRIIIAFVLAYNFYTTPEPNSLETIGMLVACYLTVTATFGNDVFYRLFNISTLKKGECDTCKPCVNCASCTECIGCECK